MDEVMGRVLGARAEGEHWDQLAQWVNDDPEPQHVRPVAQPGPEFIQLEVGQLQPLEPAVMQPLCSPARVTQRLIVSSVWPNTRLAAATLSPSASAASTSPMRCEAVFRW